MTSLLLKKRIKAHIDIDILSIEGLSKKLKSQNIKIEYKRGTGLSGESQLYKVTGKSLDLNYNINFDVSLFYSENKKKEKKFQSKKLLLYVIVENPDSKKPIKIGKIEYDLAHVATPGTFEPNQTFHVKGKDRNYKNMKLNVNIKTEWLKVDGKKLVKRNEQSKNKDENKKSKSSSKEDLPHDLYEDLPDFSDDMMSESVNETLTVEGQKYDLVTDLDYSETNDDSEWVGEESEVEFITDEEDFAEENGANDENENYIKSNGPLDSAESDQMSFEKDLPKYEEDSSSINSEDPDMNSEKQDGFKLREKSRLLESSSMHSIHNDVPLTNENQSSNNDKKLVEETNESSHKTSSEEKKKKKKKKSKSEKVFPGTESEDNIKQYVESKDELILILEERNKFLESEISKLKNSKREKKGGNDSLIKSLEAKIQSLKNENDSLSTLLREKDSEIAKIKDIKGKEVNHDFASQERIEELDYQIYNWELIINLFYNSLWTYNRNNENEYSEELSNIIIETNIFENGSKYKESVADLLRKLLVCLFKRAKTLETNSLYDIIGLFKWGLTLLKGILKKTNVSEDLKPDSHITWANDIDKNGIILRIDGLLDGKEVLDTYNVEKEFAVKIEEDGISLAFVDILDTFLSVVYVLIITTFQSKFDESKIIDLYFTQSIQKNTKPIKSKIPYSYIMYQLEKLLHYLREHRIEESIQVQILAQFFHWNSVIVVNSLINIAEYCKASCGLSIKMACSHIEQWLFSKINRDGLAFIEEMLLPMKEAANVLTIDKNSFDDESLLDNVFIHLNVAQIYQILEQFITDEFSPDEVPVSTLENLKSIVRNSNAKVTHFEVNLINY